MPSKYEIYSREELIRIIEERDRKPKFGLVWERDEIDHDRSLNQDFVALEFVPELSLGGGPWDNLLIEGDNFDALRYLRMTYAGKIKCIYIDPPYNTGNRDFIYNDRFIDKDDLYKHSKWLEFMCRRLELAKELLAEDGVMFVSIDDNEVFHLGLLMEQVFGARNFIANVIWQKVYSPKNTAMHFSDDHEYLICYALRKEAWRPNPIPRSDAQDKAYKNSDNDPRGPWKSGDLSARNFYSKGTYPITTPSGRVVPGPPPGNYWRVSQERFAELIRDERIAWGKNGDGAPRIKRFLSEVKQGAVPQTLWKYEEVGHTQDAKKEIHDILQFETSEEVFSTPKPIRLIERVLRIATNPGDLVLDFFAGSGTTAHAVLKLNREDGGNRRFILVSNTEATAVEPDKNLCRDICAERVRRVSAGYTNKKGQVVAGLGGNFAYLRARRIPREAVITDLDHGSVWTMLQLIHRQRFGPFAAGRPWQEIIEPDGGLLYAPTVTETVIARIATLAAELPHLTVYSWQPGLLRGWLFAANVTFEPIPQCLVNRFGARP